MRKSRMRTIPFEKSLEYLYPELSKEWHPVKNGELTPNNIAIRSNKVVWWYLPYDDSVSGKHFDFEWKASVNNRVSHNCGCPYLSGQKVWRGYNDLETKCPELSKEWHPVKNGELTPNNITAGSNKVVWWYLPYDDPVSGKHFDFEWKASVNNRVSHNFGCPYLSGKKVWRGYNDLETRCPELSKEWHPVKNGELTPRNITTGSGKVVWWYLSYDDPITGKHFDFEWKENVISRAKFNCGCPYLSGQKVWRGYNDLETKCPELSKEWHPIKNGELTPRNIAAGSNKVVWWYLSYDDPVSGKHFEFEWKASVNNRVRRNDGCPYLSGKKVWRGYNDLETRCPELSKEWHPVKNGKITPKNITTRSKRVVWWYLPYDDPVSGKHFEFEWKASVNNRVRRNDGCPYLRGRKTWTGYNDLETWYPDIAIQWNYAKNRKLTPDKIYMKSKRKVWWNCKEGHEWYASVEARTQYGMECPICRKNQKGFYYG